MKILNTHIYKFYLYILVFLRRRRLVYRAIQSTITPDTMQIVSRQINTKNDNGHVRRQHISGQGGEMNLIAGWSRSSQHATIRCIISYISHCYSRVQSHRIRQSIIYH